MRLPISKIIMSKVYSLYDFEPWTKKMFIRGKWKHKLKCKNKQIRRKIDRFIKEIEFNNI